MIAAVVCATALGAAKKQKEAPTESAPSPEAARVAILLYDDKTQTQNFGYMPGSLKEAITQSMREKFEFNEVDTENVDPIVATIKNANKGVIGPREASEICRKANVDILIFGEFTFIEEKNAVSIRTRISLGSTDKFKELAAIENPVDATIFQAADKVATDIVEEITKVAKEQQLAKDSAAEADKKGKTTLEKTDKAKTWADTNWMVSAGMGAQIPMVASEKAQMVLRPIANLNADYRLVGAWHVGVVASYGDLMTRQARANASTLTALMGHFTGALTLGYFIDFHPRWRWTNRLGLGYYAGRFRMYQENCQSNCDDVPDTTLRVKNPAFIAQSGIHFLIFSYLSVGLEARYQVLYDGTPLQAAGGLLTLTTMF